MLAAFGGTSSLEALARDSALFLEHRGARASVVVRDGRSVLVHVGDEAETHLLRDGALYVVVHGNLLNARELQRKLGCPTDATARVVATCYRTYKHPHEWLPMLHGGFACAVYDDAARTWFLARDCFGSSPLVMGWMYDG